MRPVGALVSVVLVTGCGVASEGGATDTDRTTIGDTASASMPVETAAVATTAPASSTSVSTTTTPTTAATTTTTTSTVPIVLIDSDVVLGSLAVADPDPGREPYDRSRYDGDGWADLDGDCLSTRHELLVTFSLAPVVFDADGCGVASGRWIDPYDGSVYLSSEEVSIDHAVPLAEAHRAGAWRWDDATKHRFVNDEAIGHLRVVGLDSNQSKADKSPDKWLPPDAAFHCQYAFDWVESKQRYGLTVTASERAALANVLDLCDAATVVQPVVDLPDPVVVVTTPTTSTTTTIAPSAGPGVVTVLSCNRQSETVVIGNTGGTGVSLSGYSLHDEGDKHRTNLGGFGTLDTGQQLSILTGPEAVAGDGRVVWKNQNVWNNDGDEAFLVAPDGSVTSTPC